MAYLRMNIEAGSDTRDLHKEIKKLAGRCLYASARYINDGWHDRIEMSDFSNDHSRMREAVEVAANKLGITYRITKEN